MNLRQILIVFVRLLEACAFFWVTATAFEKGLHLTTFLVLFLVFAGADGLVTLIKKAIGSKVGGPPKVN